MRLPVGVLVIDVLAVLLFATVGRSSHDEALTLGGVLTTAWPFLVGLACGWAVVRLWRRTWPVLPGPGVVVWVATLAVGMALRALTGAGTALAFVAVAAVVLFAFVVGLRALVAIVLFAAGGLGRWSQQVERESAQARRRR